jgi:hypothetical protein
MTVEELIEELKKYPGHYKVEAYYWDAVLGEETAEFGKVNVLGCTKIVSVEVLV